jgi:VanZ family protein
MVTQSLSVRRSFWAQVAPAVVYIALIFVGGSVAAPELPAGAPMPSDKLMHFVVFAGLQILMFRAVRWSHPLVGPGAQNLIAAVLSCVAGALLEFWQASLPHRSAELTDWLADSLGVLLGVAMLALFTRSSGAIQAPASDPGDGRG